MKPQTRNTPTERRCRECKGAGVMMPFRFSSEEITCSNCSGRGWIRNTPEDPINNLSTWRRMYRKNPTAWGYRYGQCRQRVVSPVPLPDLTNHNKG